MVICNVYFDLTRESIGIPVVRVLMTSPVQTLASPLTVVSQRTLSFQNIMGYSEQKVEYEDLYMGIYPH